MPASFYIIALITIVSAIGAISLPSLVHCALALALAFLGVAALFLQINAGFIAFAQILVYVGAVAILIVFAILLTRNSEGRDSARLSHLFFSIPIGMAIAAMLLVGIYRTKLPSELQPATAPSSHEIGVALMTSHLLPLELIGVLLTVALLGAIVLALPERHTESPKE